MITIEASHCCCAVLGILLGLVVWIMFCGDLTLCEIAGLFFCPISLQAGQNLLTSFTLRPGPSRGGGWGVGGKGNDSVMAPRPPVCHCREEPHHCCHGGLHSAGLHCAGLCHSMASLFLLDLFNPFYVIVSAAGQEHSFRKGKTACGP